ncbi:hypothetical protein BDR03DRAFT_940923 [Suillus americanus]|nr:hypothetical protein BDR03DRAFT_940923 [Suillus americanus]
MNLAEGRRALAEGRAQTAREPKFKTLWREAAALSIEGRLRHAAGLPTTSQTPAPAPGSLALPT